MKCGLKVGITIDEVILKFRNAKMFNLEDKNDISLQLNVLNKHMPKEYYKNYKDFIYFSGEVTEEENKKYDLGGMTRLLGIVLLIKDNKVSGITMDYPSAN